MKASVLAGGYTVLDVVSTDDATWHEAGGTAANVAANLAYLGWRSSIVARIGADTAGTIVRDRLREAQVDVTNLELDRGVVTPLVRHQVSKGAHSYRFGCAACGRGKAVHRPMAADSLAAAMEPVDVFVFDRPSRFNLELASRHRQQEKCVVYEPSTRATAAAHARACALATIVKYSAQRSANFADRLPKSESWQLRIVTHGAGGADISFGRYEELAMPPTVTSVDAGGAGDWMTAGVLYRLGSDPKNWDRSSCMDAIEWSQSLAALSTVVPGARSLAEAVPRQDLAARVRAVRLGRQPTLRFDPPSVLNAARCKMCGLPRDGLQRA